MRSYAAPLLLLLAALVLGLIVSPEPPPAFDVDASQSIQATLEPAGSALELSSDVLHAPWNFVIGAILAVLVFARTRSVRLGVFVLACTLVTAGIIHGAKAAYGRSRPSPEIVKGGLATSTKSYPSGHVGWTAAALGALAVVATRRMRGTLAWLAWIAAAGGVVWVALSRVYLGRHFVTDTIGAALVAAAVIAVCARLLLRRGAAAA